MPFFKCNQNSNLDGVRLSGLKFRLIRSANYYIDSNTACMDYKLYINDELVASKNMVGVTGDHNFVLYQKGTSCLDGYTVEYKSNYFYENTYKQKPEIIINGFSSYKHEQAISFSDELDLTFTL